MIEDLLIKPAVGLFDISAIRDHLDSGGVAIRDPQIPDRFLLSTSKASLRRAKSERLAGKSVPYTVSIVHPSPAWIALGQKGSDTKPARDFIEWLKQRYELRYFDDYNNDITQECADNVAFIFGPNDT
jgi:hypothetical protein